MVRPKLIRPLLATRRSGKGVISRILFGPGASVANSRCGRTFLTSAAPSGRSIEIEQVSKYMKECDAILFMSGAGLGVDSGLPDFRGPQGFWRAYPPMAKLGLKFEMMSNPQWFEKDPSFAWGFWSHRYNLYSSATPHRGFQIMKKWGELKGGKYFSFTSNVDGHWAKAGIPEDKIVECHGSVHWAQCAEPCCTDIFPMTSVKIPEYDKDTFKSVGGAVPMCPRCKTHVVRPNVLMFYDGDWIETREAEQEARFDKFIASLDLKHSKLLILEIGAGTAVQTIRLTSEHYASLFKNSLLVRINPTNPEVPRGHVGLALGALDALSKIDKEFNEAL